MQQAKPNMFGPPLGPAPLFFAAPLHAVVVGTALVVHAPPSVKSSSSPSSSAFFVGPRQIPPKQLVDVTDHNIPGRCMAATVSISLLRGLHTDSEVFDRESVLTIHDVTQDLPLHGPRACNSPPPRWTQCVRALASPKKLSLSMTLRIDSGLTSLARHPSWSGRTSVRSAQRGAKWERCSSGTSPAHTAASCASIP